ncbi:MAG TPA: YhjD/YihY/BrkB family envelope integrity protein [Nevskiaceae bacterium]|nr:YhjD/YihY/BrkB family envelope integrity protein [Nevskiaceae bacterium]
MLDRPPFVRLRTRLFEERETPSRAEAWSLRIGRYAYALTRDLLDGGLSMRAMSLVYTTLLSLVPMLALGFSVLKALGVHNMLEPVLLEFFRPLGAKGQEVTANLIGFVEKIQVGVLGSLGVALLFYTAITLIRKIEASFNFIWLVERPRPFTQRVGEYFGVLMVGPVVVFAAIGMTASFLNSSVIAGIRGIEPFGFLISTLTQLIPYLLIVGLFTFLYVFMPNARVTWRAAAVGGLAAGVGWQAASLAFASFVASATNYNAIYSGFAIVIFLLIWLYVAWLILLTGCQLAFYVQRPAHLAPERVAPRLSGRETEHIALVVMAIAGKRFLEGKPGYVQEDFARELRVPPEHLATTIGILIERGYLVESGPSGLQLIPGRDLESITLGDLWRAVRTGGVGPRAPGAVCADAARLIDEAEAAFLAVAGARSLRSWLAEKA